MKTSMKLHDICKSSCVPVNRCPHARIRNVVSLFTAMQRKALTCEVLRCGVYPKPKNLSDCKVHSGLREDAVGCGVVPCSTIVVCGTLHNAGS